MECCFFCMCRNHTHLCIAGGVENGTENAAMLASGVVYKHLGYLFAKVCQFVLLEPVSLVQPFDSTAPLQTVNF